MTERIRLLDNSDNNIIPYETTDKRQATDKMEIMYLNIVVLQQGHISTHLTNLCDIDDYYFLRLRVLILVESAFEAVWLWFVCL